LVFGFGLILTANRDNYAHASDTIWAAWSDSQIRDWLVENGYMRSDAQVKRDELVDAINAKCVRFSFLPVPFSVRCCFGAVLVPTLILTLTST
jgi:hypothetical protein